jgi:hypothetical protein
MKAAPWLVLIALPLALGPPAAAEMLDFGPDLRRSGWVAVSFPRIPPASFAAIDRRTLEVATDAAAGLLWRKVDDPLRQARNATWRWSVTQGVPRTDLTTKGSDDRALGVYFVFGAPTDARKNPLAILRSPTVTALVYVFGGDKPRGAVLSSPHMGTHGKFIILRSADAQMGIWFDENVDLANDYARAFGAPPPLLLAVAISSDSDDTRRTNRARLSNLAVEK